MISQHAISTLLNDITSLFYYAYRYSWNDIPVHGILFAIIPWSGRVKSRLNNVFASYKDRSWVRFVSLEGLVL